MKNLVIFGPPGAGKGTQSEKLIDTYQYTHISTGNLFREHAKNDTPLGRQVSTIINSGQLVPDEITIAMLEEKLKKNIKTNGFLFDGFPRTLRQAQVLDEVMKTLSTTVHGVIALDTSEKEVRERIAKRKNQQHRADDAEEKVNQRIIEYFTKTIHVLDYYEKTGRLKKVDGIGSIDEVFARVRASVEAF